MKIQVIQVTFSRIQFKIYSEKNVIFESPDFLAVL